MNDTELSWEGWLVGNHSWTFASYGNKRHAARRGNPPQISEASFQTIARAKRTVDDVLFPAAVEISTKTCDWIQLVGPDFQTIRNTTERWVRLPNPRKYAGPQKERIVFQASIFRCVCCSFQGGALKWRGDSSPLFRNPRPTWVSPKPWGLPGYIGTIK